MPFELRSTDLTDAEFDKVQTEYREFNARCSDELKEMNQNRITNIIERGGVEGWDTVSNLQNILTCNRLLIFLIFSAATPSTLLLRPNTSSKESVASVLKRIITPSGQSLTVDVLSTLN